MFVVSSVNVNGIRAAATKGLAQWPAGTAADVVCLQETRWSGHAPVTVGYGL